MTDWRTTDDHPGDLTKVWLARRGYRNGWVYGVGERASSDDGFVRWTWTSGGDPTHWAPITAPEEAE